MIGAKRITEAAGVTHLRVCHTVGEHWMLSEGRRERLLDDIQELMPVRVAIKQVRILLAESLRFPGEGKSAQG